MAAKKKDENAMTLYPVETKAITVTIEGTSDLILNQMNARNQRALMGKYTGSGKMVRQDPNMWEDLITQIHWLNPPPMTDTYKESNEAMMSKLLKTNAPCITGFGFKKMLASALRNNDIETYANRLNSSINIRCKRGDLIPVRFSNWGYETKLMPGPMKSQILTYFNHFAGWSADVTIEFTTNVYTAEQIINLVKLAGFGCGIGSGRSSGYGRFTVAGSAVLF